MYLGHTHYTMTRCSLLGHAPGECPEVALGQRQSLGSVFAQFHGQAKQSQATPWMFGQMFSQMFADVYGCEHFIFGLVFFLSDVYGCENGNPRYR